MPQLAVFCCNLNGRKTKTVTVTFTDEYLFGFYKHIVGNDLVIFDCRGGCVQPAKYHDYGFTIVSNMLMLAAWIMVCGSSVRGGFTIPVSNLGRD